MLAGIRKRLARKQLDIKDCEDDDKDDVNAFTRPTNYIKISQGKIQLVHQTRSLESDASDAHERKDREVLENRIVELEEALLRLQERFNKSHCGSPTFEKELREQLENMNRVMKSKERKQMQTCRDHKVLQTRFARQESLLHAMQQENKALILRVRQYEHCLDDVMRKVVDAIVAEDNLREEVAMLKSRVRDLEAQNAALSASPAKGRDEGYCTMSSGQPQPSNGHLEDLPEEPEQWLLPAEPCSTEMEDWSMSQEELAVITLDEEREQQLLLQQNQHQQQRHLRKHNNGEHDWIWNSNDFLNSTMGEMDAVSDGITQLLQQKIVYSEDEEVACTDFTNDFYKLVNIRSSSARSLYSYIEGDTDDEDDDDEESSLSESNLRLRGANILTSSRLHLPSPTPSEAGRAQVTSCSSSESDELSHCTTTTTHQELQHVDKVVENIIVDEEMQQQQQQLSHLNGQQHSDIEIEDVQLESEKHHRYAPPPPQQLQLNETQCIEEIIKTELRRSPYQFLVKSKSTLDEDEPICILRNNQRREIESSVVRSGSVNCAIAAANSTAIINSSGCSSNSSSNSNSALKIQERILQKPVNSWRKSNGWKRIKSPTHQSLSSAVSPKKETKTEILRNFAATHKIQPTRIPTCIPLPAVNQQIQQHQQQTLNSPKQQPPQQIRKSKIPPPVPVRRSYAS